MSKPTIEQLEDLHKKISDKVFTDGSNCEDDCFSLISVDSRPNCDIFDEELNETPDEESIRCKACVNMFGQRSD